MCICYAPDNFQEKILRTGKEQELRNGYWHRTNGSPSSIFRPARLPRIREGSCSVPLEYFVPIIIVGRHELIALRCQQIRLSITLVFLDFCPTSRISNHVEHQSGRSTKINSWPCSLQCPRDLGPFKKELQRVPGNYYLFWQIKLRIRRWKGNWNRNSGHRQLSWSQKQSFALGETASPCSVW